VHLQVPRQVTLVAVMVFAVRTEKVLLPSVPQQQVPRQVRRQVGAEVAVLALVRLCAHVQVLRQDALVAACIHVAVIALVALKVLLSRVHQQVPRHVDRPCCWLAR
jgi:hypothetical protein